MRESLSRINLVDLESINGKMINSTKETGWMECFMDKAIYLYKKTTIIKENGVWA